MCSTDALSTVAYMRPADERLDFVIIDLQTMISLYLTSYIHGTEKVIVAHLVK